MGALLNRRRYMGGVQEEEVIIMTSESNPEMLAICYAQGWAKNSNYMTLKEAQKVTNIGTSFRQGNLVSMEELQYFTSLTFIPASAFRNNSTLTGKIIIPEGVTTVYDAITSYTTKATLIFPKTLINIDYNFGWCANVVFQNETVPTLLNSKTKFNTVSAYSQLCYVPDNSYAAYQALMPTNMRANQLKNLSDFVW